MTGGGALAVSAALLCAACDLPPEREVARGPSVVGTDPADGEEDVDRAIAVRVFFDRLLLPNDVHRGNVLLTSGAVSAFLSPRFDPVDRALVLENVGGPLDPTVVWNVDVAGLRDLERREMQPFTMSFRTGEDAIGESVDPPRWADVQPILMRCADAGCHRSPDPAVGLDLSSGEGVRSTAIGVAAEEVRIGTMDDRPWHGVGALAGLARIDVVNGVGRPARSYLVYKVLGDPHIAGERMPPPPVAPLTSVELRALSEWILAGAPTD